MNIDAGEAGWITGESESRGQYKGFEWRYEDERLLDVASLPEGEVAAFVRVQKLYSSKARKTYCNYKIITGDRDGIHVKTELAFWLSQDSTK